MMIAFSSHARILGGKGHFFPPSALFFFLFLFLRWISACAHRFHFLGQDQSKVAQRAKTTVAECSLTSCVWARSPDRLPHYALTAQSAHSDFVGSRVYTCLSVTCHLHFWQNGRGLLCATAVTRSETYTDWKSAQKVNSGEEKSPAARVGTRTRNLSITSPALYQQAIPANVGMSVSSGQPPHNRPLH